MNSRIPRSQRAFVVVHLVSIEENRQKGAAERDPGPEDDQRRDEARGARPTLRRCGFPRRDHGRSCIAN